MMRDKSGKVVVQKNKAPDGTEEEQYSRNDHVGLTSLLNMFNTTLHPLREAQYWIKIKDKIKESYLKDTDSISLSIEEAAFLKTFLSTLQEKEGKTVPLQEHETRTLLFALSSLE